MNPYRLWNLGWKHWHYGPYSLDLHLPDVWIDSQGFQLWFNTRLEFKHPWSSYVDPNYGPTKGSWNIEIIILGYGVTIHRAVA